MSLNLQTYALYPFTCGFQVEHPGSRQTYIRFELCQRNRTRSQVSPDELQIQDDKYIKFELEEKERKRGGGYDTVKRKCERGLNYKCERRGVGGNENATKKKINGAQFYLHERGWGR